MPRSDEMIFSVHGLDMDSRVVRADVFAQKLNQIVSTLRTADKLANGKSVHDYLLTNLENGSAVATVRERLSRREPSRSPIAYFERAATAVYSGDRRGVSALDSEIVKKIERLSRGVRKRFAHAEILFADDNVIRIDDYLQHQAEDVLLAELIGEPQSYRGVAYGEFEGVLKEIDSRGTMLRRKLVLAPSDTEIDCVMNKDRVPEARDSFDQRVVIKGAANYDGRSALPARLDIREIRTIKQAADLTRWKGAFVFPEANDHEDD